MSNKANKKQKVIKVPIDKEELAVELSMIFHDTISFVRTLENNTDFETTKNDGLILAAEEVRLMYNLTHHLDWDNDGLVDCILNFYFGLENYSDKLVYATNFLSAICYKQDLPARVSDLSDQNPIIPDKYINPDNYIAMLSINKILGSIYELNLKNIANIVGIKNEKNLIKQWKKIFLKLEPDKIEQIRNDLGIAHIEITDDEKFEKYLNTLDYQDFLECNIGGIKLKLCEWLTAIFSVIQYINFPLNSEYAITMLMRLTQYKLYDKYKIKTILIEENQFKTLIWHQDSNLTQELLNLEMEIAYNEMYDILMSLLEKQITRYQGD